MTEHWSSWGPLLHDLTAEPIQQVLVFTGLGDETLPIFSFTVLESCRDAFSLPVKLRRLMADVPW